MKLLHIEKAHNPHKKWRAVFDNFGRELHTEFGDSSYEDYTQHKDPERRLRYRIRHRKDLKTDNPISPAYLSWYLLWGNSTSLEQNIQAYKKRFHL